MNLKSNENDIIENNNKSIKDSKIAKKCQCVPKILLVDDNDFNLMPLSILIEQLF